ncbi:MAG: DUF4830 domain-containing protein [Clostridia bacterium]|nr:DUF4830 domain-containing protein [Clostridia bacterium]
MKKYLLLIIVSLAVVLLIRSYTPENTSAFSQIVREMGYDDVSEKPYEVVEFTIPETFNAVYERYNNLLKESGYDLSPYKGKKCKRYTYLIPSENARANIIVYDGKIIGGDISGITIDGIMLPIKSKG